MMVLHVGRLGRLFCILSLLVIFEGYAGEGKEGELEKYKGLSLIELSTFPTASCAELPATKDRLKTYIEKVQLIKTPVVEVAADTFEFDNTLFMDAYLRFINKVLPSSGKPGESTIFSYNGADNCGQKLICGEVGAPGINQHFQSFLSSVTRTNSTLRGTRQECFSNIMGVLQQFQSTREDGIVKAYQEVLFVETEIVPLLLGWGEKLVRHQEKIQNWEMNAIPSMVLNLGLYKVLLDREYKRRHGKTIQSVFSEILPQSSNGNQKALGEVFSALKTGQDLVVAKKEPENRFLTYLSQVSVVVACLGFVLFLYGRLKN